MVKRYLMTGMTPNPGGVEAYIMNLVRHIDPEKVQFDYLVNYEEMIAYEQELRTMGADIIRLPGRRKHPVAHQTVYRKFFKNAGERYDGIYCNLLSLANIDDLTYAKKNKINRIIAHSHNSNDTGWDLMGIRKRLHQTHQKELDQYAEKLFACSNMAGWFMFGENANFEVIHNAIDAERFCFSQEKRNQIRTQLKISPDIRLYGTVGRLEEQKNPGFILDVFRCLHEKDPECRFIHVGDGSLRGEIEKKIGEYGLEKAYLITGAVNDTSGYYQAMDAFIFPSLYEGLPVALIEAQAADLPCFLTDTISDETKIVEENYHKIPLNGGAQIWAEMILGINGLNGGHRAEAVPTIATGRRNVSERVKAAGYDITQAAKQMEEYLYYG